MTKQELEFNKYLESILLDTENIIIQRIKYLNSNLEAVSNSENIAVWSKRIEIARLLDLIEKERKELVDLWMKLSGFDDLHELSRKVLTSVINNYD